MSNSLAPLSWPPHHVREGHVHERLRVEVNGELIAESTDVIRIDEEGEPTRYYFPRTDVDLDALERSKTQYFSPVRGTATYFDVSARGVRLKDAAWSYEQPTEVYAHLKDRIAFLDEAFPDIEVNGTA